MILKILKQMLPWGRILTHFLQFIHFAASTIGALKPFWVNASTGHILSAGQE
jgi:hypothetical protein